jgi:ribose transport system ATP-binding protein
MTPTPPLLEVRQASKRFPGVQALLNVNLTLRAGEVLALIGENGAGKSTLSKILSGIQSPDGGELLLDGEPVHIESPRAALKLGIAMIHQELNLATNLDVGANIFLGREPNRGGFIDQDYIATETRRFLEMVGLEINPATILGSLTIGRQQMVEIAKALSVDARILIMDEPTSSLSQAETAFLFKAIRDLRERGVSIIYISHRLGEVRELADRVTVLRDGENAGELADAEITHDNMVQLMIGRNLSTHYAHQERKVGEVMLEARKLRTPAHPTIPLDFKVGAREIVSIAGLVGAGRTELLETLFGVTPAVGGSLHVADEPIDIINPHDANQTGIALAPEDRKLQGLVVEMTVRENLSLATLRRDAKPGGIINQSREATISEEMIPRMGVKTPHAEQEVRFLSGGNQQKIVLGKWLATKPRILLLDEPTRGIDVGAKREIYSLMESLAGDGVAILFVSSEMEEVLGMSDRTYVMHEGRITGELSREELTEEAVMQLATGHVREAA